jgi:hypothetical protein
VELVAVEVRGLRSEVVSGDGWWVMSEAGVGVVMEWGFCFIAFSGVSQRWEFKNTTKNVLQKKSCREAFTKNRPKTQNRFFSRFCFVTFLGVSR